MYESELRNGKHATRNTSHKTAVVWPQPYCVVKKINTSILKGTCCVLLQVILQNASIIIMNILFL